ncbi:MAG: 3-hydroxyacyl-CoA dehydrogenase NAD-binding domain-containing protein [Myxococcota bacterium]
MAERLQTAAVLGAGFMGTAIAAHIAALGVRVHLLDIVPPDLAEKDAKNKAARNKFAIGAIDKGLKAKPAVFFDADIARLITPGNFEDDMGVLKDCDLVIEAVVERLDIKKKLFANVAKNIGPNAIVASNTSGLSLASMIEDLPADVQKRFVILHFFSPVRYMRLLEIIGGPKTDAKVLERAVAIGEMLGKGVVHAKDTPNFIANRIGIHDAMVAMHLHDEMGLTIEEVDKIASTPMGRPSTGAFRLGDFVGIDVIGHVAKTSYDQGAKDPERDMFKAPAWVEKLVASGRHGQKTGAGFYKKEGKDIMVLDPKTLEYRAQNKVRFDSLGAVKNIEEPGPRLKALVNADDKAAQFAWRLLARTLQYSAMLVGEIADDIVNIDRAMRWGFNWDLGPFEAWDAIGVEESVSRMKKEGMKVPEWVEQMLASGRKSFYADGEAAKTYFDHKAKKKAVVPFDAKHIRLAALHEDPKKVVKENLGASLLDLGDGVLCMEVHTKMNTLDGDVITLLNEAIDIAEKDFQGLVVANEGQHFGAGANLMLVYMAAQNKDWAQIDTMVRELQNVYQRLRYSSIPTVAAPFQYTFGGACEMVMSCNAAVAHAETYIGLVEVGVGVIPAGTGSLRCVERWTEREMNTPGVDILPFIAQASLNIATAKVATGAEEGKRLRYLSPTDGITLNRDYLTYNAKQRALGMARSGFRPPRPKVLKAAGYDLEKTIGASVYNMVQAGHATEHDALVARKVAHVLCGGHVALGAERTEQDYLDLEREAFVSLCGEEKTQARIQSILMSGKPLRN